MSAAVATMSLQLPAPAMPDTAMASETDSSALSSPPSSVPSSPLSSARSSLSPPPELPSHYAHYPSPPASQGSRQTSTTSSPTPDGMDSSMSTDKEGPPPAKRRRISKERTTAHLDLRSSDIDPDQQAELDLLMRVLHNRQKIVVIAGAGISVSAGIPDFRSSGGLFKSLKGEHKLKGSGKQLFDASVYKDDTSTSTFHDMVSTMSRLTKDAKPTAFHHMLATIAKEDRLLRLYTQNIDGIDTALEPLRTSIPLRKDADNKWPRTVQLHGGLDKMVCSKCHELADFDADLFSGPTPPLCSRCEEINDIRTNHEGKRSHGIGRLRPRLVLYNEHNPDDMAIGAVTRDDLRKRPDAVIVVGTGLDVPGVRRIAREMCGVVRDRRGGVAIWINKDFPQASKNLEDCFDIIVRGTCDEVANRAAMRHWDEPDEEETCSEVSDEDARKASAVQVEVQVTGSDLLHAKLEPLASLRHINNSFSPPEGFSTPRKSLPSPTDWSPMSSRNNSICKSIELDASSFNVHETGLLTPTKSDKSSPTREDLSKVERLKLVLKAPKISQAKKANPTTKTKVASKSTKPQSKANAPSKSKAKVKAKVQPGPKTNSLNNAFKTTKNPTIDGVTTSKKVHPSPSKLRQVLNASSEPMHAVSPQDSRNNTSPSKLSPSKRPFFPGLALENEVGEEKRKLFE